MTLTADWEVPILDISWVTGTFFVVRKVFMSFCTVHAHQKDQAVIRVCNTHPNVQLPGAWLITQDSSWGSCWGSALGSPVLGKVMTSHAAGCALNPKTSRISACVFYTPYLAFIDILSKILGSKSAVISQLSSVSCSNILLSTRRDSGDHWVVTELGWSHGWCGELCGWRTVQCGWAPKQWDQIFF